MAIENIKELESSLKLEEGILQSAIDSEEAVNVEVPELVIRTKEDEQTFLDNKQNEFKEFWNTAGREEAIKEEARKRGYTIKGRSMDSLMQAHEASTLEKAKISPDKNSKALEEDNEKLRKNLEELQGEYDAEKNRFTVESNERKIDGVLLSKIKGEFMLPSEDLLTLYKAKHSSKINEDGLIETSKEGKTLKHETTLTIKSPEEVMKEFLTSFAKPNEGGNGGGDATGHSQGTSNLEKFTKKMEKEGVSVNSMEFQEKMNKAIADKTLVL